MSLLSAGRQRSAKSAILSCRILAILAVLVAPHAAYAQSCRVPDRLPAAQPERVSPRDVRPGPITDYLLAVSWSPQYCRARGARADPLQCGRDAEFGFVLHGLWPEGEGRSWPQYCRPVEPLPASVVRSAFCATPSVSLQQHEWAKHGSCMTESPAAYFKASTALFNAVKWPDMDALSRARPDVAGLSAAIAGANRGMRADMIRIILSRGGWLEQVRICLNKSYRPARCPRDTPGARSRDRVKIWRRAA
jgi:ribonuclease T2